jgi:hypothetical protein
VVSQFVLVAVGVSEQGYREVLGAWMADSEFVLSLFGREENPRPFGRYFCILLEQADQFKIVYPRFSRRLKKCVSA